jgi:putative chitinase
VDGINAILDAWSVTQNPDAHFVAYSLATAYWETDKTLQPIPEIGRGAHRPYGVDTGPWHQIYYGRGYVQLTWLANYQKANAKLHALGVLKPEENLAATPDLALRPDVAAEIMIHGMLEGWFTGRKLGDFFHPGANPEWTAARTIINGWDHAAQIGAIAQKFYNALLAQARTDAAPAPAPAPILAGGPHGFVIGDSIGEGTAAALGWPHHTTPGESVWSIATWPVPQGVDWLVVSMGTNPGLKSPAQIDLVSSSLETMAKKAKVVGVKRIVWIQPAKSPRVPKEGEIVAEFARSRGESCIRFVPGGDGIHPQNYRVLASDVLAALKA